MPSSFSPMLNVQSSSSTSLLFVHVYHQRICCMKSLKSYKISSRQTVQLSDEEQGTDKPSRTKRKPRPSFLEQIQDKWSRKTPSLRDSFPWEEEGSNSPIQEESEISVDVSLGTEALKGDSVSESSGSDIKLKSTLPPWAPGNTASRRKLIKSEDDERSRRLDLRLDELHVQNQKKEASIEVCQYSKNSVQEVAVDRVCEDGISIRIAENEDDILVSDESDSETFVNHSSAVTQKKSLVNANGLMRLPWERAVDQNVEKFRKSNTGLSERLIPEPELKRVSEGGISITISEMVDDIFVSDESDNETFVNHSSAVSQKKALANANGLMRLPWERAVDQNGDKLRKSNTEFSEKLIPESELKRLRNLSLKMEKIFKVGASGVTQPLIDAIHEKWKNEEVVKLKFEGPLSENMKRAHEFLERRTGGLVIWRSGGLMVIYRGMAYKFDCVKSYGKRLEGHRGAAESSSNFVEDSVEHVDQDAESSQPRVSNYVKNMSDEEQEEINELNLLLNELGPRFLDWSGREPLPVDADLLPGVVPGYETPSRRLLQRTRQTLRDQEMTYLRQTARGLPPHFALGRNRELQGLALAMVKLWEKSAIAKIAIKRGVQNTSNERMAEELKILTGGTLLSRNKDFIVFYRGNDFLPAGVSIAVTKAEKNMANQHDEEEQARQKALSLMDSTDKATKQPLVAGTLAETVAATSCWGNQPSSGEMAKMIRETAIARQTALVRLLQKKLALAKGKIRKAEKVVVKVHENQESADLPTDLETLTDEERFLFRKIGLSMRPYLLLGRREIFDGTIENMHLHWKYRELVKIIVARKNLSQVKHIAITLEAESGGVLVSVEDTMKGYVIIVYRGKNYQKPSSFRPKTLLTKRQALSRSIELQRREALKHHVLELEEKIKNLEHKLDDMKAEQLNTH